MTQRLARHFAGLMWLLILSCCLSAWGRRTTPMHAERVRSCASVTVVMTPSKSVKTGFPGQARPPWAYNFLNVMFFATLIGPAVRHHWGVWESEQRLSDFPDKSSAPFAFILKFKTVITSLFLHRSWLFFLRSLRETKNRHSVRKLPEKKRCGGSLTAVEGFSQNVFSQIGFNPERFHISFCNITSHFFCSNHDFCNITVKLLLSI